MTGKPVRSRRGTATVSEGRRPSEATRPCRGRKEDVSENTLRLTSQETYPRARAKGGTHAFSSSSRGCGSHPVDTACPLRLLRLPRTRTLPGAAQDALARALGESRRGLSPLVLTEGRTSEPAPEGTRREACPRDFVRVRRSPMDARLRHRRSRCVRRRPARRRSRFIDPRLAGGPAAKDGGRRGCGAGCERGRRCRATRRGARAGAHDSGERCLRHERRPP
jgi:hypothetical protein